jgi:hypothetical protein
LANETFQSTDEQSYGTGASTFARVNIYLPQQLTTRFVACLPVMDWQRTMKTNWKNPACKLPISRLASTTGGINLARLLATCNPTYKQDSSQKRLPVSVKLAVGSVIAGDIIYRLLTALESRHNLSNQLFWRSTFIYA